MKKLVCIFSLLVSLPTAHAFDAIEQLQALNPDATPYQILKKTFDDSHDPIRFYDLAMGPDKDDKSSQECVYATPEFTRPKSIEVFRLIITKKGQPSAGPLFPGTPDLSKEVVSYGNATSKAFEPYFDKINILRLSTEIIQTDTMHGEDREFILRKSGPYIVFHIQFKNNKDPKALAGYCWNTANN